MSEKMKRICISAILLTLVWLMIVALTSCSDEKDEPVNRYDSTLPEEVMLTATDAADSTEAPTDSATGSSEGRRIFTVTYINMDGTPFETYNVYEGDPVPEAKGRPTYEDDNFTYTFTGWDLDIDGVDFEHLNVSLSIAPKFDVAPKK